MSETIQSSGNPEDESGRKQDAAVEQRFDEIVFKPLVLDFLRQAEQEAKADFDWRFPNFVDDLMERIQKEKRGKQEQ